ncbi:putative DNA repair protein RAD2 [Leishmania infantum JPCM5]|uniref:DNA_repair_protein_RAD2_-_putative n=2 Tax=Leishmania infantum TaxID=5671 RepID=A0A6L0XVP1_LEIIN|nr:putative DNA repair protein RAD2 [Leishmania infantum JPCM5]CAC9546079.1 DNA_repair_protein_RAD2_-_putative [Leishmania infantum]CAM72269.1 putative DNA repair protein RAD2 [Leishmania infantum JPCM5]SUZ46188.1 DNA_repair_protein_RAD2_-_putative [Leishmania infantum]|eukprot:XP_001469167.1 putative DNA repair protein RAD2 [Leishmania infantum JPCM5]
MGVHGLWRLLDSFGVVVQPDELKGKRVAIDASIWIAQFRARVAPGEDTEHKVLEGFLARILKLLFYGIHPVFVFDGPASSSKGAEHHRRTMQQARNARALVKRRARQILLAQVAAGALDVEDLKAAMPSGARAENNAVRAQKDSDAAVPSMAANAAEGTGVSETLPRGGGAGHALGATSSTRSSAIHGGKRPREASEEVLPLPRPHRRRLCRRQRRLAPDAVSATITQSFLRDVEGLLEERTRHEACVLQNALQSTSTSLFMGPRRTVDENSEAVVGVITSGHLQPLHPHRAAAVVLVSGDSQEERDATGCVVISDSESGAEAVSSASCTVASTDGEGCSDVEEVVLVEKAGGPARADAPEGALWLPSSASSPSVATAVLHSGDMTRFLNARSQSTCTPPPELMPSTIASEGTSSVITSSSSSAAQSVSGDEGIATDLGSSSTSNSKSAAFPSDGSSEEADTFTDGGDGDDSDDAEFAWEPFTQRLHLAQLLRPQEQESESHAHSSCSTAAQMVTASFAGSPRTDAATVGKEDGDEDDYAPVRAVEVFSRCRTAPVPLPMVGSTSSKGEGEKDNCTIPVSAPQHSNAVKGAVSEVAGSPYCRSAEVHSLSTDRKSSLGGVPPREGGAARTNRVVIPFELLNVVELLDCCGVPYVLSPAEADAQCAFLARCGLVDAVFTEDSDVLVHGATTVLRGFFAQSKNVVAYEQTHLSACGITKTVLVALASLLGCDYTEGVCGIGLVGALEALVVAWTTAESAEAGAASSSAVLHLLRRWALLVQRPPRSWQEVDDHMTILQFALLRAHVAQWRTLEQRACFPEAHAVEAFFDAKVDLDTTPFQWLPPDWQRIRVFAGALGALSSPWLVQRYELARKECLRREETAAKDRASLTAGQRRLTEYGVRDRVRARWAFQRQPPQHAAALAKLRAVQQMQ